MLVSYLVEQKRKRERREFLENFGRVAAGAMLGMAIGGMTGILFAPKSGEETRKDISDKATEITGNIKAQTEKMKSDAEKFIGEIRANVANSIYDLESASENLAEEAEKMGDSVVKIADNICDDEDEDEV